MDLLSSGFGFVISVNDLEECVQFLSRMICSDSDKEIKMRLDGWKYLVSIKDSQVKALTS